MQAEDIMASNSDISSIHPTEPQMGHSCHGGDSAGMSRSRSTSPSTGSQDANTPFFNIVHIESLQENDDNNDGEDDAKDRDNSVNTHSEALTDSNPPDRNNRNIENLHSPPAYPRRGRRGTSCGSMNSMNSMNNMNSMNSSNSNSSSDALTVSSHFKSDYGVEPDIQSDAEEESTNQQNEPQSNQTEETRQDDVKDSTCNTTTLRNAATCTYDLPYDIFGSNSMTMTTSTLSTQTRENDDDNDWKSKKIQQLEKEIALLKSENATLVLASEHVSDNDNGKTAVAVEHSNILMTMGSVDDSVDSPIRAPIQARHAITASANQRRTFRMLRKQRNDDNDDDADGDNASHRGGGKNDTPAPASTLPASELHRIIDGLQDRLRDSVERENTLMDEVRVLQSQHRALVSEKMRVLDHSSSGRENDRDDMNNNNGNSNCFGSYHITTELQGLQEQLEESESERQMLETELTSLQQYLHDLTAGPTGSSSDIVDIIGGEGRKNCIDNENLKSIMVNQGVQVNTVELFQSDAVPSHAESQDGAPIASHQLQSITAAAAGALGLQHAMEWGEEQRQWVLRELEESRQRSGGGASSFSFPCARTPRSNVSSNRMASSPRTKQPSNTGRQNGIPVCPSSPSSSSNSSSISLLGHVLERLGHMPVPDWEDPITTRRDEAKEQHTPSTPPTVPKYVDAATMPIPSLAI